MSLRHQIGRALQATETWLLSRPAFPLLRRAFGGRNWCYDACRFSGTRDFRCVFDVGANVGHVAREFRRFFPSADIHAFEPVAATHAELAARCGRDARLHAHRLALSDHAGSVRLRLQGASELNSLHYQATGGAEPGEEVEVTTLDAFCGAHRIDAIDLLKVDAQGCDLQVLHGGAAMLRDGRIPFVLVEASFTPDDVTNQPFAPLHDFATGLGFRACGVYDQLNYGPRWSYLGCFNLLYVQPEALRRRFPAAGAAP